MCARVCVCLGVFVCVVCVFVCASSNKRVSVLLLLILSTRFDTLLFFSRCSSVFLIRVVSALSYAQYTGCPIRLQVGCSYKISVFHTSS